MKSTLVEELKLKQIDEYPEQFQDFVRAIEATPYLQGVCFFSGLFGYHYILTTITINLPSHGSYEGLDIRSKEDLLFRLDSHYPYHAPNVTINRTNFPFASLPHVNMPLYAADYLLVPQTLCLHRSDINEWFIDAGPKQFLERIKEWLKDAAKGELIKDDGFEPMMRLECKHSIIYDLNSIHQLMEGHPKNPVIAYRNVSNVVNNEWDCIVKVNVNEDYKNRNEYVPCLVLFDQMASPTSKYLGHHNNRLGDFFELFSSTLIQRAVRTFNNNRCNSNELLCKFLLIYGVRRPQPLIGSSSDIELVNCLVELPEYTGKASITGDESCFLLSHCNLFGRTDAAQLSNASALVDKKMAVLGCGALGSKISLSLARMGATKQTLIDKDKMLPHNLTRHALPFYSDGSGKKIYKTDMLSMTINELYEANQSCSCPKNILDIPCDELNSHDYLIDCTASKAVLDYLTITKRITTRIVRSEIAQEGQLGLTFFEGIGRSPDLYDLRYVLYYQALHDDTIYQWLQHNKNNTGDFAHQEIQLGLGCSSDTMVLDDAVVSVHAGVAKAY
ncbi:MAG: ThiF family adenylyltransferase [Oscillospiraceae bacterium]|nr:ThiF family adenylyltransferase [Oscillospiraceae bacterium]